MRGLGVECSWKTGLEKLDKILCKLGYRLPTPIQEKAFRYVVAGRNTLIVSPTGTGKTEAALVPVLYTIMKRKMGTSGVKVAYITPLRALNRDITYRMKKLVEEAGYTIAVRHGDSGQRDRRRFVENPPTFMVTTPETFNLIISIEKIQKALKNVRWIVVDEIHELMDSKRGIELLVTLKRLERISGRRPQLIGLSATLSQNSIRLVSSYLGGYPSIVQHDSRKDYDVKVEVIGSSDEFWKTVPRLVLDLQGREGGNSLVFVNTRQVAEKLGYELSKTSMKDKIRVHHGSLHRQVREEAEKSFKNGRANVLIATSSMELGVDIGLVDHVIQIMSPRRVTNLSQRIGRSGHFLGKASRGYIVTVPNLYEILESLVIARRVMDADLEDIKGYRKPLDVLAHQIVGFVLDKRPVSLLELYEYVSSLKPYEELGLDELEEVVDLLSSVRILRRREGEITWSRRTRTYFYNVSMIPDEPDYLVVDLASREVIGKLSERFITSNITPESPFFVLAGRIWRVVDIDPEKGRIQVQLQGETDAHVPSWEGELIPVDYKVAREVCGIIQLFIEDSETAMEVLEKRYGRALTESSRRKMREFAGFLSKDAGRLYSLAATTPLVELMDDGVVLHTCLGSKGNYTLGVLVSSILSRVEHVEFARIPYAVLFTSKMSVRMLGKMIVDALRQLQEMDDAGITALLVDHLRNTFAYKVRMSWIAKRMGIVDPDRRLTSESLRRMAQLYKDSAVEREVINEMLIESNDLSSVRGFLKRLRIDGIALLDSVGKTPTILTRQVLDNPYMRRPETASGRVALLKSIMIDAVKKRLENTEARMVCMSCGYTWLIKPSEIRVLKCPRCGASLVAVTWKGDEESPRILRKYKRGETLSRDEERKLRELNRKASLLLTYSMDGLHKYAVEALMARGIGPRNLPRVMARLVDYGEREFYKAVLEEERKYAETRKYWD